MAGITASVLSNLTRPNVQGRAIDLLYRETDFVNLLRARGCFKDGVGGTPYKWNLISAANTSVEVFNEGAAPPAAGRQTTQQASVDAFYIRGTFGRSGHVRDNMAKGAFYEDPMTLEGLVEADVMKKLEDEFVGSTADRGIASIVDATGTYAGISQASVSAWASEENTTIGTLGIDDLQDLYEEMTSATVSSVPRNASPTDWLMPVNQITNYANTIGAGASSGGTFRHQMGQGGTLDFGQIAYFETSHAFCGVPIRRIRGLTSTEIYLVDLTGVEILIHRDLRVDPILGNPEMEQFQVSFAVAAKYAARNKHGKMTGVTA
jgi:hypothetical protein